MAPDLGEWWWVPILAAAIGGFIMPFVGYFRRPRNGPSQSTMHGSMMIDSSVARDALEQLTAQVNATRRLADAAEGLLEVERDRDKLEQRRREAEYENAVRDNAALKRKLDEQERDKR